MHITSRAKTAKVYFRIALAFGDCLAASHSCTLAPILTYTPVPLAVDSAFLHGIIFMVIFSTRDTRVLSFRWIPAAWAVRRPI